MPRHPPCALHSLSHKHNTTTTTKTYTTHTPPNPPPPRKEEGESPTPCASQDARVHYADLKQQTHQHQPPHNRAAPAKEASERLTHQQPPPPHSEATATSSLILQDPTVCQTNPTHATAPGSTPHTDERPPTGTPHPHEAVLKHDHPDKAAFIDDSTSEHHHTWPHTR